jgi:hypothetical protein
MSEGLSLECKMSGDGEPPGYAKRPAHLAERDGHFASPDRNRWGFQTQPSQSGRDAISVVPEAPKKVARGEAQRNPWCTKGYPAFRCALERREKHPGVSRRFQMLNPAQPSCNLWPDLILMRQLAVFHDTKQYSDSTKCIARWSTD